VAGLPGAPVRVTQVAVTSVRGGPENGIAFGGAVISGSPPVLLLPLSGLSLPGEGNTRAGDFTGQLKGQDASLILNALVGLSGTDGLQGGTGPQGSGFSVVPPARGKAAQLAVAMALARVAGLLQAPPGASQPSGDGAVRSRGTPSGTGTSSGSGGRPTGNGSSSAVVRQLAAQQRFAALPAAARHAWLISHLAALRAGRITLSEIP